MNNVREEVLAKALECVNGDRDKKYGSPENSFGQAASLWTEYLGAYISPTDVAMMMILLKISRHLQGSGDIDNFVDIAGYAACAGELFSNKRNIDVDEKKKGPDYKRKEVEDLVNNIKAFFPDDCVEIGMKILKGVTNEKPEL